MRYQVYCPSYKRAASAISHRLFLKDRFRYVVHEFETEEYRKSFPDVKIVVCPDEKKGNIARVRNWIMDNSESDQYVTVDDDIKEICIVKTLLEEERRERVSRSPEQIDCVLQNGFQAASDLGLGLWGINCQNDAAFYRQNMPLSFRLIVLGTFSCIRKSGIKYDESITLKEDYDFFLQHMARDRRVLRFNMFNYLADHLKKPGGCQIYRTSELEEKNKEMFLKKWGSQMVTFSDGDFNPVIRI